MPRRILTQLNLTSELQSNGASGTLGQVLLSGGSGAVPTWGTFTGITASSYVAQGSLSGDQTIASNTNDVLISFVDDFDPQGWWNPTSKRFQPTIAGYYNIALHAWWTAGGTTTNQYNVQIRKNGNTSAIFQNQIVTSTGLSQGGSRIVFLNGSTDYIDFTAFNGDTSTRSLQWGGAGQGTWFSAALTTSGANITSNALTVGTSGLTMTTGSSPWTGSAAATIDIDTTKVPRLSANNTFTGSQILSNASSSAIPLTITGAGSQSADLILAQDSSLNAIFRVRPNTGNWVSDAVNVNGPMQISPTTSATGYSLFVRAGSTVAPAILVRAATSHLSDLQTWQDSGSNVIASLSGVGQLFLGSSGIRGTQTVAIGTQTPTGTTNISITTGATHGISVGQVVTIAGVSPSGYNGSWTAQSGTTGTTLVVNIGSNPGAITVAGTVTQSPRLGVTALTAQNVPLIVRAASGQVNHLQQWQDSSGNILARIDGVTGQFLAPSYVGGSVFQVTSAGIFSVGAGSAPANTQAYILATAATNAGLAVRGAANQTADILQIQSSAATVLGGRNGVGQIFTGSTTPILTASGGTIQSIATGANPLVTMASAHGFAVGDLVTLAGTTGGTYNGTFVVASTPLTTTFTITTALTAGQAGTGGTASDPAQLSVTARSAGTVGAIIRGATSQAVSLQEWQDSAGTILSNITSSGVIRSTLSMQALGMQSVSDGSASMAFSSNRNVQIGATTGVYGSGAGVIGITNATTAPTTSPTGGGILFVNSGALTYRGTSGGNTTIVNADGTVAFTSPSITTSLTTPSTSFDLINATATTVNFAGAATTLSIGNTATAAQTVNMFTASTGASTYNFATGAVGTGVTKTLNIGTGAGTAGTTVINMGGNPAVSTSTINLNAGTINSSAATLALLATPATITMGAAVTTLTIAGTSTANVTANLATGVTTGSKIVNIGTGGTAGSVSVNIGSSSGSASTVTINGTITGAPTAATATTAANNLGYVGMPQNSQSGAYGLVAADAGKHIYYTTTGQTVTIPANSNVAFQIGTTITFITAPSVSLSIAITTDTLRLANSTSTGTRTLAANGVATAIKTTATTWIISGNGLT